MNAQDEYQEIKKERMPDNPQQLTHTEIILEYYNNYPDMKMFTNRTFISGDGGYRQYISYCKKYGSNPPKQII